MGVYSYARGAVELYYCDALGFLFKFLTNHVTHLMAHHDDIISYLCPKLIFTE